MRLTLTGCAVFICYAMDKDTHSVTNAEVHEVFSQVRESPLPCMTLFPSSAVSLCLTFSGDLHMGRECRLQPVVYVWGAVKRASWMECHKLQC